MPAPTPPLSTGNDHADIQALFGYLADLHAYLLEGEPDPGWSSSGFIVDRVLTSGDTLVQTQNVISTIIDVLKDKKIFSS